MLIAVYISTTWALALIACGVAAVLLTVGWKTGARGRTWLLDSLLHLLAGGLTGFLSIAFFPAAPLLAAILGMLVVRAAQADRWTDIGLLSTGFGAVWTALLGAAMVNDRLDPAVTSQDGTLPFAVGAALLIFGIVLTAGARPAVNRNR
jgi:hypothetical protein